jgi:hypothetical protein
MLFDGLAAYLLLAHGIFVSTSSLSLTDLSFMLGEKSFKIFTRIMMVLAYELYMFLYLRIKRQNFRLFIGPIFFSMGFPN